jgi:hypothetical protein
LARFELFKKSSQKCEFWRALNFLKKSSQKNKKAYLLFGALFAKSA